MRGSVPVNRQPPFLCCAVGANEAVPAAQTMLPCGTNEAVPAAQTMLRLRLKGCRGCAANDIALCANDVEAGLFSSVLQILRKFFHGEGRRFFAFHGRADIAADARLGTVQRFGRFCEAAAFNGFCDSDPRPYPNAMLIERVEKIDGDVSSFAGGAGSRRGTGGMKTKLRAAGLATANGTEVVITNGKHPEGIYDIVRGDSVGTPVVGQAKR